jgi:hypothetical protein
MVSQCAATRLRWRILRQSADICLHAEAIMCAVAERTYVQVVSEVLCLARIQVVKRNGTGERESLLCAASRATSASRNAWRRQTMTSSETRGGGTFSVIPSC